MIPVRRRPILFVALVLTALTAGLQAQVRVHLKMSKSQYVAHEPVEATITLTNHAGRDLLIHSDARGYRTVSWLDFSIRNARGKIMSPAKGINFKSVRIPAGQSVSKTIDLNAFYRVTEYGNYNLHAVVRMPDGGGTFTSNRTGFTVTKARTLYSQRIGVPGTRNVREYRLLVFNASQKTSLYVQVQDPSTGRMLQTYRIGEALMFQKPQATVDGQNILHVLFLNSPTTFAHARVNPDGTYLGAKFFKRAATGQPGLQTFANGQVVVAGGVPFDPDAERRQRAQIRKLSERPRLTYR